MPHADLGDRRLHYIRRGSGEPLLLIQGMSGHHRIWGEPFLALLEQDFDLVAYDHRGIGDSDRADEPFTIGDLADDAARLITAMGWEDAHVLGISMGGMVAQELALRHPRRVRTLTLGCTYAGGEGSTPTSPGLPRVFEAVSTGDAELVVRASYEANLSRRFTMDPEHYEPFRATSLAVRVPVPVVMMQIQAAAAHQAGDRLSGITAPTLVVHGTADEMLVSANGEHIARLVPGARLELLDGVGHLFWWEEPERSAALLREHALGPKP